MTCPNCGHEHSHVARSEREAGGVRRQRECDECLFRWSTFEASLEEFKKLRALNEAVRQLPTIPDGG